MTSQFTQRAQGPLRGMLLGRLAETVTYTPDGAADRSISAAFQEKARDLVNERASVDQMRVAQLIVSTDPTAGVSSPGLQRDTVTVNSEVWTVHRIISRDSGLMCLELRLREQQAARRPGRRVGL